MRFIVKWLLRLFLLIAWLGFSVVVGGLVLSAKEKLGINIFRSTGYHAFEQCLVRESQKAIAEELKTKAP